MHSSQFLKNKYSLHNNPGVKHTANRTEKLTGEKIHTSNAEKSIQNFLDRYHTVLTNRTPEGQKSLNALKRMIFAEHIIKPEEIPEAYWELQKRIARERWMWWEMESSDVFQTMQTQEIERILSEQKQSLKVWIDYLGDETALYDPALKYWVFRSVTGLQNFHKEKWKFEKRSKGTTAAFPELNREALAQTIDSMTKYLADSRASFEDKILEDAVKRQNFGDIYAYFLTKSHIHAKNILENIQGEWMQYPQWSDHMKLVESISGKNTGWCTAGEHTAESQLNKWDFYVYYSEDENGNNTIPRLAIRMEWERIAEVRWIEKDQHLDPYIWPILSEKLKAFWREGEKYQKKEADMRLLTHIDTKQTNGEELTQEELRFLYEIDAKIEWFGYGRDVRIEEIIQAREIRKDLAQIFDCDPPQISLTREEALFGKDIVYHYDMLDLSRLTTLPEGFRFPEKIGWNLDLSRLTTLPEGVKFPESIGWSLDLHQLTTLPEGFRFPESIGWYLNLSRLTTLPEGFRFPKKIGWDLYFSRLTTLPEGVKFPESIGWSLTLYNLTTLPEWFQFSESIEWNLMLPHLTTLPEGMKFPESIGWYLNLSCLTTLPKGFQFPEYIKWGINLHSLTTLPEGVEFPEYIKWDINLRSLTTLPEGVEFPEYIEWDMNLHSLTTLPEGVEFPKKIGWSLDLHSLTTLPEGIEFPKKIGWGLDLSSLRTISEGFRFPEKIGWHLNLYYLTNLPEGVKFPEEIRWSIALPHLTEIPSWIHNINAQEIILP